MERTNEIIAGNIKNLRKASGMTQSDLAEKLGYTVQAISRWEKGKSLPDPVMLYHLAELFQVEITYFYQENHVQIDPENEKRIKRRENIFRIVVGLTVLLIIGLLLFTILLLIDTSIAHIVLWIITFVSITSLALGIFLKSRRLIHIFIPINILTIFTSLYFFLKNLLPDYKVLFVPMIILILIYFVYLFLFNRKKL